MLIELVTTDRLIKLRSNSCDSAKIDYICNVLRHVEPI